jgi:hypothetical protein
VPLSTTLPSFSTKSRSALANVLKIEPAYRDRVADDLARRGVSPSVVRAVVDGLVKAGLRVPPSQTHE